MNYFMRWYIVMVSGVPPLAESQIQWYIDIIPLREDHFILPIYAILSGMYITIK